MEKTNWVENIDCLFPYIGWDCDCDGCEYAKTLKEG